MRADIEGMCCNSRVNLLILGDRLHVRWIESNDDTSLPSTNDHWGTKTSKGAMPSHMPSVMVLKGGRGSVQARRTYRAGTRGQERLSTIKEVLRKGAVKEGEGRSYTFGFFPQPHFH